MHRKSSIEPPLSNKPPVSDKPPLFKRRNLLSPLSFKPPPPLPLKKKYTACELKYIFMIYSSKCSHILEVQCVWLSEWFTCNHVLQDCRHQLYVKITLYPDSVHDAAFC